MSRCKFEWTVAALAVTLFLALMLLLILPAQADEVVIPYLSVEPDWLVRFYLDGRTVRV